MSIIKARPITFSGENIRAIQALLKNQTRRVITPQPWRNDLPDVSNAWVWSPKKHATGLAYAEMMQKGYPCVRWAEGINHPTGLARFSPYAPGDHLWVKETWRIASLPGDDAPIIQYKVDGVELEAISIDGPNGWEEDKYLEWCRRQGEHIATDCAKAGIETEGDGIYRWTAETNPNRWHSSRFMPRWASRLTLEVESSRAEQLQHITARDCLAEGVRGLLPPFDEQSRADVERIIADFKYILRWGFMALWDASNAKRGYGWYTNPWVFATTFCHLPL